MSESRKRWGYLPARPGVYLLFCGDQCVYAGSSQNLQQRIMGHALRGQFDRVEHVECDFSDLRQREQALIDQYNPPLNKVKDARRPGNPAFSAFARREFARQRAAAVSGQTAGRAA